MQKMVLSKMGLFIVMVGPCALCSANAFGAIIYVPDQNETIHGGISEA